MVEKNLWVPGKINALKEIFMFLVFGFILFGGGSWGIRGHHFSAGKCLGVVVVVVVVVVVAFL